MFIFPQPIAIISLYKIPVATPTTPPAILDPAQQLHNLLSFLRTTAQRSSSRRASFPASSPDRDQPPPASPVILRRDLGAKASIPPLVSPTHCNHANQVATVAYLRFSGSRCKHREWDSAQLLACHHSQPREQHSITVSGRCCLSSLIAGDICERPSASHPFFPSGQWYFGQRSKSKNDRSTQTKGDLKDQIIGQQHDLGRRGRTDSATDMRGRMRGSHGLRRSKVVRSPWRWKDVVVLEGGVSLLGSSCVVAGAREGVPTASRAWLGICSRCLPLMLKLSSRFLSNPTIVPSLSRSIRTLLSSPSLDLHPVPQAELPATPVRELRRTCSSVDKQQYTDAILAKRQKIVVGHRGLLPEIGCTLVNSIKVKHEMKPYHLTDAMLVWRAFNGVEGNWYALADASSTGPCRGVNIVCTIPMFLPNSGIKRAKAKKKKKKATRINLEKSGTEQTLENVPAREKEIEKKAQSSPENPEEVPEKRGDKRSQSGQIVTNLTVMNPPKKFVIYKSLLGRPLFRDCSSESSGGEN
ncbi:COP1-interacting protein 4 [Striga asiatica]|uniref:COP1-interacting protein 4 n=1 Tax=Striga asiatica TaxID=4170 RepID=A0A5A7PBN2_STRAF|nr:COP1-interacting protein 4 [Striga asiatica]